MNKPKIIKNDSKNFFRTITFKAWLSFLSLAVLIISLMVAIFMFAYSFGYRAQQIDKTVGVGKYIIEEFPTSSEQSQMDEFDDKMDEFAVVNNMSVVVFSTNGEVSADTTFADVNIIYVRTNFQDEANLQNMREISASYFSHIAQGEGEPFDFTVSNKEYGGADVVIGASKLYDGQKVYFFVQTFIKDRDFATDFFYKLFFGMSIIAFAVSVFYAFFVGKKITEPLVKLSKEVRIKGKNPDYEIAVDGYESIEIEELARSLEYSANEQKKTEEFRRDLVANVSHDLRTPLTMIKAYAEMIRDLSGNNPQKREQHCDIIINEVDTLNSLVGDLLNLSKLQAGTVELDLKYNALDFIVKTVLDRLNMFTLRDGYEFIVDMDENVLCLCDSKNMEQAIYNLICNAINYTGKDKKVYISLKVNDGKVRFSVKDTGKGIKKEEIERIWDKYYRANQAKRSVAGSGIGLSIVQSVLLQHKMQFGVDSQLGQGSTFWFETDEVSKDN